MSRILLFNLFQLAVSAYALRRGGAPERVVGLSLLLAAAATWFLQGIYAIGVPGLQTGVMIVDLVLLTILVIVALHADRYWVAWVAALHMLGTGAHLAQAVSPEIIRLAYVVLSAVWSYPILLLLAFGTLRHARRRRAGIVDLDWSLQDPTLR